MVRVNNIEPNDSCRANGNLPETHENPLRQQFSNSLTTDRIALPNSSTKGLAELGFGNTLMFIDGAGAACKPGNGPGSDIVGPATPADKGTYITGPATFGDKGVYITGPATFGDNGSNIIGPDGRVKGRGDNGGNITGPDGKPEPWGPQYLDMMPPEGIARDRNGGPGSSRGADVPPSTGDGRGAVVPPSTGDGRGADVPPGTIRPDQQKPLDTLPFEGERVERFQPGINPRLGCALAVSSALHEMDPTIPVTNNNRQLERILKEHGYELVPHDRQITQDNVQPGDVLIGHRQAGMPGHAAIYKGNGQIYENDSNTGRIRGDGDLNEFNQTMHDKQGHWNKNGFEDVMILRRRQDVNANISN